MQIQIVNKSDNPNPTYQTKFSAGMDLMSYLEEPIIIKPGEFKLISTGIHIKLPESVEAQVRPRSSPGTIDSDYRGEIGVILINHSKDDFIVKSGDRIAQLVIAKHESIIWNNVESIDTSLRGEGGFGSTGLN